MPRLSSSQLPYISLAFCGLLLLFSAGNVLWNPVRWKGIVRSDGKGYYAYLPATVVYQDLNFGFFEELEGKRYFQEHLYYDYRYEAEGHTVNRYFAGTAVALAPFYLLGHAVASVGDFETDGYSLPYYLSVHLGTIFYTLLGLYGCIGLLRSFELGERHIAWAIPAILLGSNLFYYAMMEPLMSHPFSFCFVSALLLNTRYWLAGSQRALIGMGFCMGMIILIRPINGVILLLLPFMAQSWGAFWQRLWQTVQTAWKTLWAALVLGLAVVGVQLLIYYLQTGTVWVYSYGEYRIDLGNPHFWDMLISYRKGFFLYTPLAFLGLAGFYFWGRTNLYQALGTGLFLIGLVYLLSCWDFWYYGGSFGSRVLIDFYSLWAVLLGFCWQHWPSRWSKAFTVLVVLLVLVCQVQTFQYRYQEILWDNMTRELYWDRFLRIDRILWPD